MVQVETRRFNATYSRKDERTPLVDFLLLAAAKAKAIYSQAYAELARQVGGASRDHACQGTAARWSSPVRWLVLAVVLVSPDEASLLRHADAGAGHAAVRGAGAPHGRRVDRLCIHA